MAVSQSLLQPLQNMLNGIMNKIFMEAEMETTKAHLDKNMPRTQLATRSQHWPEYTTPCSRYISLDLRTDCIHWALCIIERSMTFLPGIDSVDIHLPSLPSRILPTTLSVGLIKFKLPFFFFNHNQLTQYHFWTRKWSCRKRCGEMGLTMTHTPLPRSSWLYTTMECPIEDSRLVPSVMEHLAKLRYSQDVVHALNEWTI